TAAKSAAAPVGNNPVSRVFGPLGSARSRDRNCCSALRTPPVVSATATRVFASISPRFTWSRTTRPSRATTIAEMTNVVVTMRNSSDWRQRRTSQFMVPTRSGRAGLVADAPDGDDDLRMLRVDLDLRPQPLYVHV